MDAYLIASMMLAFEDLKKGLEKPNKVTDLPTQRDTLGAQDNAMEGEDWDIPSTSPATSNKASGQKGVEERPIPADDAGYVEDAEVSAHGKNFPFCLSLIYLLLFVL